MNTLATVWLLVSMGVTGNMTIVDVLRTQAECTAILQRAPADSGGLCIQALRPR